MYLLRLANPRLLVVALALLLALVASQGVVHAAATILTVNSANDVDDGTCDATHCSLREAIIAANANAGTDTIAFDIPGAGPHTIQPTSALPWVTDPVVIDGYTQPGASPNTNPVGQGLNTVLKIELDGTNAGTGTIGLLIGGNSTLRGLAINRFTSGGEGIRSAAANVIEGNFIGTDVTGTVNLGNTFGIVVENASANTIGGTVSGAANLISGNGVGILFIGTDATANVIQGNFIGTDVSGTAALGNGAAGVKINGASNNTIGGTVAGARNVISGNDIYGVFIIGSQEGNLVQGNFIGTDVTGTAALGNTRIGVLIDGASNNTIGGTTSGTRNVISANGGDGVVIGGPSTGNSVQGNFIGTDATGTVALGNLSGVTISNADSNTIGGTTAAARNIISGNNQNGVHIDQSATGNLVQGNFIGIDVTGTAALGNLTGVSISGADSNTIGGTTAGARNIISGNSSTGVSLSFADGTIVQGNFIGTDVTGTADLGNGSEGVFITASASNNTIGGTADGAANTIAFNRGNGVFVFDGTSTAILSNSIFSNTGLGIDLGADGVTANDMGDADTGANNLQNFPVLSSAVSGSTTIDGTLNSTPDTTLRLEFFTNTACDPSGNGEGESFLGSSDVTTDDSGDAGFTVTFPTTFLEGQFITATATDPENNTSEFSRCSLVKPTADLSVTKRPSPDPVIAGTTLTYTVTVANSGPDDAMGVSLIDTLAEGVTFISAMLTQGSCSESGGTLTCALGAIVSGAIATVTIEAAVDPSTRGTLSNTARVTSNEVVDPDAGNNTATDVTNVDAEADLSIKKTDSPDAVLLEEDLTYTVTVTNNGPSDATEVTLIDTPPMEVSLGSATPTQGSCSESGGTVTCALDSVVSGASATVTIVVIPTAEGAITNTASVTGNESDPDAANNSASENTTVEPAADLLIGVGDSSDPVIAGTTLTYTVTVTNNGPSDSTGVTLIDTLAMGVTFISAAPTQGSCSESGSTVICNLGDLANGDSVIVTINVTVDSSTRGTLTAATSVTANEPNPVSTNNTVTEETTVNAEADVSVMKSHSPDPVIAGANLTYTATITNNGPSDATGVTVTDTVAKGVAFISATPTQGSCSQSGGTITCDVGGLTSDDSAIITILVTVDPSTRGTLTTATSVTANEPDPVSTNNSVTEETTVNAEADLSVTVSNSPDPVRAKRPLTYTVTVANNGPSDATQVTLTKTLQTGAIFDSATLTQGSCEESSGTVTCNLGTLSRGASMTVAIVVSPTESGFIDSTVKVTSHAADPDTGDNLGATQAKVTSPPIFTSPLVMVGVPVGLVAVVLGAFLWIIRRRTR